jgi:hypothetical protein
MLVAQFLRARAWWRLDSAGPNAVHVARSVVCLLDAVAYLQDVPDDDPGIAALAAAGCFRDDTFDPGPEGAALVRDWQFADERSAGPADLLAQLAQAAPAAPAARNVLTARSGTGDTPAAPAAKPAADSARSAGSAVTVPRQAGPAARAPLAEPR